MQDNSSFSTFNLSLIFILFLSFLPPSHERCPQSTECRGERPTLQNGCCPVEPIQACFPEQGLDCDTGLGFYCADEQGQIINDGEGTCRGQYNLAVLNVSTSSVNLTWDHVAQELDNFEYVVMYRESTFYHSDSGWKNKDVGERPKALLKELSPGTLYFVKVAIWSGRSLGNYSEVIMVDTVAASYCEHKSKKYEVGEQFVHECEDNCTCMPNGQFQCHPVCPEDLGVPQAPEEGCEYERSADCCTYIKICHFGGEPCSYNNQTHNHLAEFMDGCQECQCNFGSVDCRYSQECSPMEVTVSCPKPKVRDVGENCCPEWECESTCTYENQTYNHLQYFSSSQCGLCQCNVADGVQCASDCPPVAMVLPDAACPDPQIKKDGCCETLHCHDPNTDILQFMRNMFALSYSPATLTLSFEVDSQEDANKPLYCQYEILYTSTSDPQGNWSRRLIQPTDVLLQQDQSSHTNLTDPLTHDSAIVVGKRAYVTLSGMHPNTTYYVKIIPLDGLREDMSESQAGQLQYSDRNISAMVVVKTKSLVNVTSCFHDGNEVLHLEVVPGHCGQKCQCILGQIKCQSICESEAQVVASSTTCPVPRLERKQNDCCPTWTCYPSASGCIYNGLIMSQDQSLTEVCQVCTCRNSSVQCTPVCQTSENPPRPGCELTNITGQCCPQWSCPLETHPPSGVRSTYIAEFLGNCDIPHSEFKEMVAQKLRGYLSSQPACAMQTNFCDSLSLAVTCPGGSNEDFMHRRRRRSAVSDSSDKIYIHVSVYQNFSSNTSKEVVEEQVRTAGLKLLFMLNTTFELNLDNRHSLKSTNLVIYEGLSYVCDHSFSYVKDLDTCILSEIESVQVFKPNVQLTATTVSETCASLQWTLSEPQDLNQVQGFVVEYRQDGSLQWMTSHVIGSSQRLYNITSLKPDVSFTARLVALLSWSGSSKWRVAEIGFRTASIPEPIIAPYSFPLKNVAIHDNWALLTWEPLPSEMLLKLSAVSVIYKQSYNSYYTHKQIVSFKSQTQVQLIGLQPDTVYSAEITMLFFSGDTKTSGPVHFVTKFPRNVSTELLVAVIIACVVSLIATVVVIMTCFMWRKSKKKGDTTGFENKTFGIPLENNNEERPSCHPVLTPVTEVDASFPDITTVNLNTDISMPANAVSN
ncbi:cysteine-rich motor neuron 1 protein-like isoform X3 [Biomphalaria pfeifferi]|uniref:Cysteine-rich motor neuron 1 protein-like isoform X3 n=1 Tax=Biomphalaria pfeifferi TaxID=112525 RepID=A0AAD8BSA5_BIOPF|nr:cysteine-rich motor neuron 1 protein-like isoform X3 [Biomphalaria pfeifferi]